MTRKNVALPKRRRKVKQKNNWVTIKDKKKKARQLESDSYNEPIKQGKDKHCADQAESLLDSKKRNATRRNGIEQRQGHRDSHKTARLQQMDEGRRRRRGVEERRTGGEE